MNRHEHLVASYLDGELTPEETLELSRALADDPCAADEFVEIFRQSRGLEALHWQEDPAAVHAIMDELLNASHAFVRGVMGDVEIELHRTAQMHWPPWLSSLRNWSIRKSVAQLVSPPGWALVTATGIALLCCAWFFYYGVTTAEPKLELAEGASIDVVRSGMLTRAQQGFALREDDVLNVSGTNAATISFAPEKTRITNWPGTELKLVNLSGAKRIILGAGKIEASVARQRTFKPMVIRTPQAEARVLGTLFTLAADTNATRLEVTEGKVRLSRPGAHPVTVAAGQYAVASINAELAPLPATGRISHEVWTNYPGKFIAAMTSDANVADHPQSSGYVTRFETALTTGTRFGQRIRGYVHPPSTGNYSFSIAATGVGESYLFLSRDENPQSKIQIWVDDTGPQGTGPAPPPLSIPLVAGRKYYIEALHESQSRDGGITARWQGPTRGREIIPGEFLSPFPVNGKKDKR